MGSWQHTMADMLQTWWSFFSVSHKWTQVGRKRGSSHLLHRGRCVTHGFLILTMSLCGYGWSHFMNDDKEAQRGLSDWLTVTQLGSGGQNLNPAPWPESWGCFPCRAVLLRTAVTREVFKSWWQFRPWNRWATFSGYLFDQLFVSALTLTQDFWSSVSESHMILDFIFPIHSNLCYEERLKANVWFASRLPNWLVVGGDFRSASLAPGQPFLVLSENYRKCSGLRFLPSHIPELGAG